MSRSAEDSAVAIRFADGGHRRFVEWLSDEAFRRYGEYEELLGEALDQPDVLTLVAEQAGRPVGFAMVDFADGRPDEAYLLAIAVDPDRQGEGIGSRLLERVGTLAAVPPGGGRARVLRLNVAEDNTGAIRLFERHGFVRIPGHEGRYPGGQRSLVMLRFVRRG